MAAAGDRWDRRFRGRSRPPHRSRPPRPGSCAPGPPRGRRARWLVGGAALLVLLAALAAACAEDDADVTDSGHLAGSAETPAVDDDTGDEAAELAPDQPGDEEADAGAPRDGEADAGAPRGVEADAGQGAQAGGLGGLAAADPERRLIRARAR